MDDYIYSAINDYIYSKFSICPLSLIQMKYTHEFKKFELLTFKNKMLKYLTSNLVKRASTIQSIKARQIFDSRGNPTV